MKKKEWDRQKIYSIHEMQVYEPEKKKNGIKRIWIDTITECEIVGFNNSRAA